MAKEKVVGQSTRKPLRRTPMQKKLTEEVQDLIRLHYVFKNNEPFIPVIKDFLKGIHGEDFKYKRKTENPIKRLIKERAIPKGDYFISTSHLIHFTHDQKVWFVKIMDLLQESIKERSVDHFYAVKWVHITVTHMWNDKLEIIAPGVIIEESSPWNITVPEKSIYKQAAEALRKQESQSQPYPIKGSKKRIRIETVPYREYEVKSDTDFGVALLQGESITYALEHPTWEDDPFRKGLTCSEIHPINLSGWRNYFLRIVRSLLVNYHIAFGNFKYIKTCEYNPCKKLFVEKRADRGHFCSKDCERKFRQASPKYKCMNRQNAWILREIPKIVEEVDELRFDHKDIRPYNPSQEYVSEGACKRCDTCMESGECAVLKKNNKKVLAIQKALPVIRKEFSNPLIKEKEVVDKLNRLFDRL